jgi:hypothetical protein
METPDGRTSFGDSDTIGALHNREDDTEKHSLLGEGSESIRRGCWRSLWTASSLTFITILNIILFLISTVILLLSNRMGRVSDQENWRATSYYCTRPDSL